MTIEENLIADEVLCRRLAQPPGRWDPYYLNMDGEGYLMVRRDDPVGRGELPGNLITDEDPQFIDPQKGDFRLRDDSRAFGLGFEQIPVDRIGLQVDVYRRSPHGS